MTSPLPNGEVQAALASIRSCSQSVQLPIGDGGTSNGNARGLGRSDGNLTIAELSSLVVAAADCPFDAAADERAGVAGADDTHTRWDECVRALAALFLRLLTL